MSLRGYRGALAALALAAAGLTGLALAPGGQAPERSLHPPERPVLLSQEALHAVLDGAAREAGDAAMGAARQALQKAFAPVHAAIPAYADFHYSVRGEYAELTAAAMGTLAGTVEARLFAGHDARLAAAEQEIWGQYGLAMAGALARRGTAAARAVSPTAPLAEASQLVLKDALGRASAAKPAELAVLLGARQLGGKALAAALSRSIAKTATRGAGKLAARSAAGTGSAAAAGAAAGAVLGPGGALAGGIAAGAAAWLGMDWAVIRLDEALTREDFEARLGALVTARQEATLDAIASALARHREDLAGTTLAQLRAPRQAAPGAAADAAPPAR